MVSIATIDIILNTAADEVRWKLVIVHTAGVRTLFLNQVHDPK
jgi:hypothetical protein